MIRSCLGSLFVLTAMLAPALDAQDKPAPPDKKKSPWAIDRALRVSPQPAPTPALKYRLLPLSSELKEGNAVPIYLRLVHEQSDASRKLWTEKPAEWNKMPVADVPVADVRKFFKDRRYGYFLRQFELGARRRTAEWNYTLDAGDPIGLLLPDAQVMRSYAPILVLQARLALAEGDFSAAAHHLETGFAFSRHIAEGPTLIHSMVAFSLAAQFTGAVGDFVERPDAPNLYWALTALPRPLIDLRKAQEWEFRMVEMQFPELGDLERARTPEQWDGVLRRMRTELRAFVIASFNGPLNIPDWYPKDFVPENAAAKSPDLPAARKFVARSKNLSAEQVEAMPPAQVLLLYIMGTYHEHRDELFRAFYLPYPQAFPMMAAASKRLRDAPVSEGVVLPRMFLPALHNVRSREIQFERSLTALRVVEALRIYAASHEGRLPDKLEDVTEVPVPVDPGSDRPFEYSRDGDTATVAGRQLPDDPRPKSGVRYRVTIRKK